MRNLLKNIIIFLIQIIEKYEFRNQNIDETDPLKKIVDILPITNKSIKSDYGFPPISEINKTTPLSRYKLVLENGNELECADDHIVYCGEHTPKFVNELTLEDYVITKTGISKVKQVKKLYGKISMFDFTINGPEPSYYTNDILSHNTISAAIVILHFVLFNDDKGVMIVANKGNTVKEIVRKIKDIYKLLPFFIKKGVVNWNEKSVAFENNSRIQSENRTKDPAIGFTIDMLYLDEFAHIQESYVRDYYGAIVPVVSAVNNSKIIITSTPDGYNLFHDLLVGAEKEPDDPLKNPYTALRVYWWQVEGRQDTTLQIVPSKLKKFKFTKSGVLRSMREQGITFYKKNKGDDIIDCVKYDADNELTHINNIRKMRVFGIPIPELFIITNWQEEETKLIGGEDKFKQEYDLHFITGDKLLFDRETMDSMKNKVLPFNNIQIPHFDERLTIPYESLKWVVDKPDLLDFTKLKSYYTMFSVDLGEGLAQDYSVINIFRLMLRDLEDIKKNRDKFENIYDLFKLEQIGMYRNNIYSIREVAHIFYLLSFEFFDPEKSKTALEYNTYGGEFLSHLPTVFDSANEFFNAIFLRYKHRKEDERTKIGIKLSKDKHLIVDKDFQQAVKKKKLVIHNDINITEISTFSKQSTPGGNITYRAESGNDDCVMTNVILSTAFDNVGFKNLVDMYIATELNGDALAFVEKFAEEKNSGNVTDFASMYGKVYGNKKKNITPFVNNIPYTRNSPFN